MLVACFLLLVSPLSACSPRYGPARGALVIAGGGNMAGTGIVERFIELAGGPDAKFVIVPTAQGNRSRDGTLRTYREDQVIASWQRRGLKNVRMLHTADPAVADHADFVEPLLDANAVWFDGGRQWNIVDSYMGTRTLSEFRKVLERGGVIGGSSAGATIQGDYLVRGDTSGPDVMMTEEKNHQRGFALLRRSAIDQHVDTRNRWDDLVPVVAKHPDLLGLGLSEGTAIVVTGDRFQVMGRGKVAVHDGQRRHLPGDKAYDLLSAGDVYDLKTRSLAKPAPP